MIPVHPDLTEMQSEALYQLWTEIREGSRDYVYLNMSLYGPLRRLGMISIEETPVYVPDRSTPDRYMLRVEFTERGKKLMRGE